MINGQDKVRMAIEAMNPGYKVIQMTDFTELPESVTDSLMVAVVNAPPPITNPDMLAKIFEG
tara:strand:+ start:97 stop:282 length:186 start_codon:yes stop_codon:yes gene_type:complete